jgi:hypothetical protein
MNATVAPDRQQVTRDVLVVNTLVVPDAQGSTSYYFEIYLAPDTRPGAEQTLLVTREIPFYDRAANAEGTPERFDATWHPGKLRSGKRCKVLDRLEAAS